jgi:hypothetical protein
MFVSRFLAHLAGTLPQRTFARATAYRHHLLNQDEIMFSPTCSSGMIYCLLDMLAYNKVSGSGKPLAGLKPLGLKLSLFLPQFMNAHSFHRQSLECITRQSFAKELPSPTISIG